MEHQDITTNGIRLHVMQDGPTDGPLLILLHGFPEFWYGWRKQIPYFAAAGYRVWVPDQRGYSLSDKPRGIAPYNLDELAADVVGLIDAAGRERAFLVGHDWGGACAWWVAAKHPQRLEKLVVMNAPHGAVMSKSLRRNPAQRRRSWYMFVVQLPWLPEIISRRRNWHLLTSMLRSSSLPGTFTDADIAEYRQAWSQPGGYAGMLSWYRAMTRTRPAGARPPQRPASSAQDQAAVPARQPVSVPVIEVRGW